MLACVYVYVRICKLSLDTYVMPPRESHTAVQNVILRPAVLQHKHAHKKSFFCFNLPLDQPEEPSPCVVTVLPRRSGNVCVLFSNSRADQTRVCG